MNGLLWDLPASSLCLCCDSYSVTIGCVQNTCTSVGGDARSFGDAMPLGKSRRFSVAPATGANDAVFCRHWSALGRRSIG